MIAVNNEYAYGDEVITPIDEIAVIPPVSGG
jgi:molybdopterin converting factor small subunit